MFGGRAEKYFIFGLTPNWATVDTKKLKFRFICYVWADSVMWIKGAKLAAFGENRRESEASKAKKQTVA